MVRDLIAGFSWMSFFAGDILYSRVTKSLLKRKSNERFGDLNDSYLSFVVKSSVGC